MVIWTNQSLADILQLSVISMHKSILSKLVQMNRSQESITLFGLTCL